MKHISYATHTFTDFDTAPFCVKNYSRLKFGSDAAAKKCGYELAESFFAAHADAILANNLVIIPSPYNYVKNAATVMTQHLVNRLNDLVVAANGNHVEFSIIHRKVSYTNDYGFLSKEKRRGLIDNDTFYVNKEFIKGKLLVFVDDVCITGTHEDKLKDVLTERKIRNDAFFIYYAKYFGNQPDIEAKLNFAAVESFRDYLDITKESNHHTIIRPIKYLLGLSPYNFESLPVELSEDRLQEIYYGCLAEGYYKIPQYQDNFRRLQHMVKGE